MSLLWHIKLRSQRDSEWKNHIWVKVVLGKEPPEKNKEQGPDTMYKFKSCNSVDGGHVVINEGLLHRTQISRLGMTSTAEKKNELVHIPGDLG